MTQGGFDSHGRSWALVMAGIRWIGRAKSVCNVNWQFTTIISCIGVDYLGAWARKDLICTRMVQWKHERKVPVIKFECAPQLESSKRYARHWFSSFKWNSGKCLSRLCKAFHDLFSTVDCESLCVQIIQRCVSQAQNLAVKWRRTLLYGWVPQTSKRLHDEQKS